MTDVDLLVIGESPGYHEDQQGRAFVGEAGNVLDQLLNLVGLKRSDIYITNILKCHPPRNHNPNRTEIDACIDYLHRQIKLIKPKIIITLGKYASREIFAKYDLTFSRISNLHGNVYAAETSFGKVKVIPMYHPAVACYHDEMLDTLKKDFAGLRDVFKSMLGK